MGGRWIAGAPLDVSLGLLNGQELIDRSVEAGERLRDAERGAHGRGVLLFADAACDRALEEARRLAGDRDLEEAARRLLQAEIDAHVARRDLWRGIARLLEDAARLALIDCELEERAERGRQPRPELPPWGGRTGMSWPGLTDGELEERNAWYRGPCTALPGWEAWTEVRGRLLEAARALFGDGARVRDVLQSRPDVRDHLLGRLAGIGEGDEFEGARVAREPSGAYPDPGPDEFPIVCERRFVRYDLLRWGTFVEPAASAEASVSGTDGEGGLVHRRDALALGRRRLPAPAIAAWRADGGRLQTGLLG